MTTPPNPAPDTWVAIDFETATREANSACALGIAIVRDGRVERTESWLIQPPFNEYEYRNMLVHGITAEDTALAPDFAEVWWEVAPLLAEGPLLAHNAPFDIRVLRALITSYELAAPVTSTCAPSRLLGAPFRTCAATRSTRCAITAASR